MMTVVTCRTLILFILLQYYEKQVHNQIISMLLGDPSKLIYIHQDMHKAIKHADKKNVAYSCDECDYKCSNDQHLKAHNQIVHVENQTPFECGICQYQCRKRCLVVKHMKIVHEKSKPFPCTQCPRAFSANCILLRHVEMVHEKVI